MKILWRRVDHPGLELCDFQQSKTSISLNGLVLLTYSDRIYHIEYEIMCSPDWRTKSASIKGKAGTKSFDIRIEADLEKHWYYNDKRNVTVDGCTDIDLGFSPSTNILPIRRLHLLKRTTIKVTAAWIEFPSFKLKPLPQTYSKKSDRIVHYESASGKFQRDLEINSKGMVTKYPGLWEVEAVD
jgi:uncharacterized protein